MLRFIQSTYLIGVHTYISWSQCFFSPTANCHMLKHFHTNSYKGGKCNMLKHFHTNSYKGRNCNMLKHFHTNSYKGRNCNMLKHFRTNSYKGRNCNMLKHSRTNSYIIQSILKSSHLLCQFVDMCNLFGLDSGICICFV